MINTFIWLRWKTFFSHTPENYADLEEAQDAIRFYADCVDHNKLPYVLGVEQDSDKATALYPKAAVLKARRPSMPLSG